MKNTYRFFAVVVLFLCFVRCDLLDVDPTGTYSESTAFASMDNVDLYVKYFYTLLYSNADIDIGSSCLMDDGVTDLLKYSWYGVTAGQVNRFFYEDNYVTEQSNFRSNWSSMYTYIRRFNEYFADVNYGYADDLDKDELKIRTAEVRFLRAFAYQELVIRHGGVILRIDEEDVDSVDENNKARSTEDECWDFIIGEYESAAEDLPESWDSDNTGRVTKGAAIGMKARAALYAERWDEAIEACDSVLAMDCYSLLSGTTADDYYEIFTTVDNSELLLPVYYEQGLNAKQQYFDYYVCPPYDWVAAGISGSSVGAAVTPSDEYASSFDILVDGSYEEFDWDNLDSYGNAPFDNREPRFYASILYNGAAWKDRTLELYVGGNDGYMDFATTGQDNVHTSTTGYIIRKFAADDTSIDFTSILSGQYWIEMRLAEIYLIRSEAYAQNYEFANAYEDLNTIRARVGLPELSVMNNWDDYLEDLQKERICELGLEGHRYFDLIRWGKAVETLDGSRLHAIKITLSNGEYSYERVECDTQDRSFPEKYTIFPIPYTELQNNTLCEQNDLWK